MKKKKLIIVISLIVVLIVFLIGLYFYGLTPVSKSEKTTLFTINSGESKVKIVEKLKESGLIKSKISLIIYLGINRGFNLQAGKYELSPNMSAKKIIKKINAGEIKDSKENTFTITFIEGKRFINYAEQIAKATNTKTEEVLNTLNDKEYLSELINEYWFLTNTILDSSIYYPLEGYLYPSTYEFYNNSGVKDIVKVMLDTFGSKLKTYEEEINNSKYSVHEIISMASIVELEGANSDDRAGVAGVFYNRLKIGESLGSDVTTYYAARKDFSKDLTWSELDDCSNGYNTRGVCNKGKLPVGPICSPSIASLVAALNPSKHDYLFFVADKNKKTYFTKTNNEHARKISELKSQGLWYEYS